ncbi:MAG: GNAT family protein [Bacteroidota bacterium]|nr:GNAT family protein [Bacteroidota bacterium]MDP4230719.1 GNAT family protein [Bacteroidota bacterium]
MVSEILSHPPTIETERLILRPLTLEDAEAVYTYGSDPEVTKNVSFDTHKSIEDSITFLRKILDSYSKGIDPASLGIVTKASSNLIGTIGYLNWNADQKRIEIGYAIAQPYWNKGYVSEAARALIDYLFRNSELERIEAICRVPNVGSARVMEKAGMTFEGILRKRVFFKGELHDMKMYSLLRDEWQGKNSN